LLYGSKHLFVTSSIYVFNTVFFFTVTGIGGFLGTFCWNYLNGEKFEFDLGEAGVGVINPG